MLAVTDDLMSAMRCHLKLDQMSTMVCCHITGRFIGLRHRQDAVSERQAKARVVVRLAKVLGTSVVAKVKHES